MSKFQIGKYLLFVNTPGTHIMLKRNRCISYIQGQSPEPNTREYFYFIDHQGMLFLDDTKRKNFTSCFNDKKFLESFFKNLTFNDTGRYEKQFPFLCLIGYEKNFVRCDDLPIVFTHIFEKTEKDKTNEYLSYAHAGELLKQKFEPEKICMLPESGRVYHPGPERTGGVGLIKTSLAFQLSEHFLYEDTGTDGAPSHIIWKNRKLKLSSKIIEKLKYLKRDES